MTNKQLIAKFNSSNTESVCVESYPWIGGYRATFYRNVDVDVDGGWLIAIDSTSPTTNQEFAYEIPKSLVDKADAIEFDVCNDAAYAMALLRLSDAYRNDRNKPYDRYYDEKR